MASGRSIEKRKTKIDEVNKKLEGREQEVKQLEDTYSQAYDLRMQMEGMEDQIDEEVSEQIKAETSAQLEALHEQGEQLSESMISETQELDEVRQENSDASDKLEQAAKLGSAFDSLTGGAVSERIDEKRTEIQGVQEQINETQKKIDDLANRAKNLSKRGGGSF